MKVSYKYLIVFSLLLLVLSACGADGSAGPQLATVVAPAATAMMPEAVTPAEGAPVPLATVTLSPVPSSTPVPTLAPWRVGAGPAVPPDLVQAARDLIAARPDQFVWSETEPVDLSLVVDGGQPLAGWVYVVVAPFPTVADDVSLTRLQATWQGGGTPLPVLTTQTSALLENLWGPGTVEKVPEASMRDTLWQIGEAWSVIPFHRLTPDLKVLRVDGVSPLDKGFDPAGYPLAVQVGITGEAEAVAQFQDAWSGPATNRDSGHISRVAMTGVTALVRATAYQMEIRDLLYPGEEVAPVLQSADFAHVSNEVSFVYDCPPPHYLGDPVFCSDPRYLALLESLGVDIVELTGNHLNDWGAHYIPYSLGLYDEAGMRYFGGGRDVEAARAPILVEHNGNQIAFVGCNPVGPAGAWATAERGGSNPCDYEAFYAQIGELAAEGYLVIATQQYQEIYNYAPTAQQRVDFQAIAAAGAAAVSGSQGHHAQGFAFHEGAFIHYGLGNLFFDQMDRPGTRQTFVDTYTIYDGRLLSVELWTGLIENYARPRLMTAGERAEFLQTVFQASGW